MVDGSSGDNQTLHLLKYHGWRDRSVNELIGVSVVGWLDGQMNEVVDVPSMDGGMGSVDRWVVSSMDGWVDGGVVGSVHGSIMMVRLVSR